MDHKALVLYIGSFYEQVKDMEMPGLKKVSQFNELDEIFEQNIHEKSAFLCFVVPYCVL